MFAEFDKNMQGLSNEGYFKALAKEGKLTLDMVQAVPITKICDVFIREEKLEQGDYMIFEDGTVERFEG